MYPSSNSSSASQPSRDTNTINGGGDGGAGSIGLARYRSAPVSFLNTTVDSVINGESGQQQQQHTMGNHMVTGTRFFSSPNTTSSQLSSQTTPFRLNEFATAFSTLKPANQSPSPLFRHGSSPAGFLNTLVSSTPPDGRGSRLSSQISFAGSSSFSQMSHEETNNVTNPLVFSSSTSRNKRAMESEFEQFNFGLSESGLDANTMDLPHDSVPCKIRAKRGCATHPRSIAERERRTRISGKLKKLQDLVPNMDKQTSYSDMLDLAVQHIKGLQTHVQDLKKELQNCSCGCKPK